MPDIRLTAESAATLKELSQVIRRDGVIAFAGAGISADAKYKPWTQLLDAFHDEVNKGKRTREGMRSVAGDPKKIGQLQHLDSEPLWRADEYERLLGRRRFCGVVKRLYGPRRVPPGCAASVLTRIPFKHYLTTNYDPLLERAAGRGKKLQVVDWAAPGGADRFLRSLRHRKAPRQLVYLHGRYCSPESIVLSESDYLRRYVVTDTTSRKLLALFMVHRVLFVGFSLSDPELDVILRLVRAHSRAADPWHFAIFARSSEAVDEQVLRNFYRGRYGIDPIFYNPADNHRQLRQILQALTRASSGVRRPATLKPTPRDPGDPNKGNFGECPEAAGWRLHGAVTRTEHPDWFHVHLTVKGPKRRYSSQWRIRFHLHPTFPRETELLQIQRGGAELERFAYGAFTAGAVVFDPKGNEHARLELDLAELKGAPARFRSR